MSSDLGAMNSNDFIEQELIRRLIDIEKLFDADALSFSGPLVDGVDNLVRSFVEELVDRGKNASGRLALLLTTEGGYIETVQRIVETIRHNYRHVCVIIPDYAFSAGTVLAMSGDDIHMDYYSRMGPIDPQVPGSNDRMVPALGYIKMWEDLVKKAKRGKLSTLELQIMIAKFDMAELYQYGQARDLSITLLEDWLAKYKFKDWDKTETRGIIVTDALRKKRAKEIGKQLNDTDRWHSHGRGIPMSTLQDELNLRIDDLAKTPERHDATKRYHGLLDDYMQRRGHIGMLHTKHRYQPYHAHV